MRSFAITREIPAHLKPYIVEQDPSLYTPIDHAGWRYILRVSRSFFSKAAHEKYLTGLQETGISTDSIPSIQEMDQKLSRFGWRAVAVSGFIPPSVFMEFQSLGVLQIACDMRNLQHLAYTPAPDIVHEAAGHAPIIADPSYATYLRTYGEVARKAIASNQDMEVYYAIRNLSDVKEDPASTDEDQEKAQERLDLAVARVDYASEAALLARMNWWTVEYGLVGSMQNPKIYGAGLLSSVGESYHCLGPEVKKIPFSVRCVETSYDITRPQPQLFVTPDFDTLTRVLEEFASGMAYKTGGTSALAKAKQAGLATTIELDTGIQISGILSEYKVDSQGEPAWIKISSQAQLAYQDQELDGHGISYHSHGYSTPIGPSNLSEDTLQKGIIEFRSGIRLEGVYQGKISRDGKTLVAQFKDCRVTLGKEVLFEPAWGVFDLACGTRVTSVFGGAADRAKYLAQVEEARLQKGRQKSNTPAQAPELNSLYAEVRKIREHSVSPSDKARLNEIAALIRDRFPEDWLLRLELLELGVDRVRPELEALKKRSQVFQELISRGLALLEKKA